jgi:hypothetical protein
VEIWPNLTPSQQKALEDHAQALAKKKSHCCNGGCMECGVYRLGRGAVQAGIPEEVIDQICKVDAAVRETKKAQEAARTQAAAGLQPEPTSSVETESIPET